MKTRKLILIACLAAACLGIMAGSAQAAFLVSVETPLFYTELSPHGTWVSVAPFGWVWSPSVARCSGWRPYYNHGSWVWTDYGWYWRSYYSWGGVPFHYGRWVLDGRHGWVWVPDGVWGPSWVSWRYSAGHCGWAPLPPGPVCGLTLGYGTSWGGVSFGITFDLTPDHYVFVPHQRVCDGSPDRYAVPAAEVAPVYEESKPVSTYRPVRDRVEARIQPGPSVRRPIVRPAAPERTTRREALQARVEAARASATLRSAPAPKRTTMREALQARVEAARASAARRSTPAPSVRLQARRSSRSVQRTTRTAARTASATARVAQARAAQAAATAAARASVTARRAQIQARVDDARNRLAGSFGR